jgi:hypothetical protein
VGVWDFEGFVAETDVTACWGFVVALVPSRWHGRLLLLLFLVWTEETVCCELLAESSRYGLVSLVISKLGLVGPHTV